MGVLVSDEKYLYWLAVEESKTVAFADLPHLIANALHPAKGERMAYAAARINLENELAEAVKAGTLTVRNPAGMGPQTYPVGDALWRSVLTPSDLRQFLSSRGIELRLTAHGSGPKYWTLQNASEAIQEQFNWTDEVCADFQDRLQEAAASGSLVLLDPRTLLPTHSKQIRTYWELVTPEGINTWLATLDAPYRWDVQSQEVEPIPEHVARAVNESPMERRSRWLNLYEEEMRTGGKYGALQRAADREGVDRSNMKKGIDKALNARTEQSRAGVWDRQLVQDGKRKV